MRVRTSGWSYQHWRGSFYPKGVASRDWLAYYAERFDAHAIESRHPSWEHRDVEALVRKAGIARVLAAPGPPPEPVPGRLVYVRFHATATAMPRAAVPRLSGLGAIKRRDDGRAPPGAADRRREPRSRAGDARVGRPSDLGRRRGSDRRRPPPGAAPPSPQGDRAAFVMAPSRYLIGIAVAFALIGIFTRSPLTALGGASLIVILVAFAIQRFLVDAISRQAGEALVGGPVAYTLDGAALRRYEARLVVH